ncbi:hypothetical protein GCM10023321_82670 [Pseudonocardia eucalypti]|uniref:Uncharacterized protein n=1 Tax=Pseudonocardia eucalypti TaxID=648755 RepID=A0ABP9REN0_9PSEU
MAARSTFSTVLRAGFSAFRTGTETVPFFSGARPIATSSSATLLLGFFAFGAAALGLVGALARGAPGTRSIGPGAAGAGSSSGPVIALGVPGTAPNGIGADCRFTALTVPTEPSTSTELANAIRVGTWCIGGLRSPRALITCA